MKNTINIEGKEYVLVPVEEYKKEKEKEIEKLDLDFNSSFSVEVTGDRFEFGVLVDEETLQVKENFCWLTIYTDESQETELECWDNPDYLREIANADERKEVDLFPENYSHEDWLIIKALCQKAMKYGWL